ncbi:hypothetical protein V8G54_019240 [Vigna mungo]|uniref:Uncharacterized protein n=1 Tax=Vigna mungo TaxID=3915 RepID=A0AAQ3N9S0_VIGMU
METLQAILHHISFAQQFDHYVYGPQVQKSLQRRNWPQNSIQMPTCVSLHIYASELWKYLQLIITLWLYQYILTFLKITVHLASSRTIIVLIHMNLVFRCQTHHPFTICLCKEFNISD